ncbi:MAG: hypothetical protein AAGA48_05985 [Myxococcota bacterium]
MIDVKRLVLPLLLTVGCNGEDLPGSYFDVERQGAENRCTGNGTNFRENLPYRLVRRGNEVTLAVGPDEFATGISDGCTINYNTIVWTSQRQGFAIDWQVEGEALVDPEGGDVCNKNGDWVGAETYSITNSEHPDVSPGCTYTVEVSGDFTMMVE